MRTALSILVSHGAPLALGAAVALAWRTAPPIGGEFEPGPPTTWVADRDADAVVGLDDGLFEAKRIELTSPVELERAADGALWVVSARDSHPLGPHDLVRYGPDGRRTAAASFGPVYDLERLGADALVVERTNGAGRVACVTPDGSVTVLASLPTVRCASGSGDRVAIGTEEGDVLLLDIAATPPALVAQHALGGIVGDLAPGPTDGTWWVLDVGGAGRLRLLEPNLVPRWTITVGLHALHLLPIRGEERVWLADTTAPVARRYGSGGALELDVQNLPLSGLDRGVALAGGGVLLAAPGAVLHLDATGTLQPGQGGFDFLVDLTR